MPYKIKGDVEVARSLTVGDLTYPTTDGAPGQIIVTDGAGNLSFNNLVQSHGIITADPAPAIPGRYALDASGGGFFFTLPAATGSHEEISIAGHDAPSTGVLVRPQAGETLNGTVDGTFPIDDSQGHYIAIDKEPGYWECIRVDLVGTDHSGPFPQWRPGRDYISGEPAVLRGQLMYSYAGHTSGAVLDMTELKNWRGPSPEAKISFNADQAGGPLTFPVGGTHQNFFLFGEAMDFDNDGVVTTVAHLQGVDPAANAKTLPRGFYQLRFVVNVEHSGSAPDIDFIVNGSIAGTLVSTTLTVQEAGYSPAADPLSAYSEFWLPEQQDVTFSLTHTGGAWTVSDLYAFNLVG